MNPLVNINSLISSDRSGAKPTDRITRPTRAEMEEAVRTLIRGTGDDPDREGLVETPARVARAYREWFAGYDEDPDELLQRTFEEVAGYDEMVLLRDIHFVSAASITWRRSWGERISVICRAIGLWESRSWLVSLKFIPGAFKFRKG